MPPRKKYIKKQKKCDGGEPAKEAVECEEGHTKDLEKVADRDREIHHDLDSSTKHTFREYLLYHKKAKLQGEDRKGDLARKDTRYHPRLDPLVIQQEICTTRRLDRQLTTGN